MVVNIMTKLHNDLLRDIGTLARTIHYLHDLHFKELALQRGQFIFLTRICENISQCFGCAGRAFKVP